MGLGPLNYYSIGLGIFGIFIMVGYVSSDCDATLAILAYNLLGQKLPHPECGTAAVLFLRFFEAQWLAAGLLFIALGIAPKCGFPVSKAIYAMYVAAQLSPLRPHLTGLDLILSSASPVTASISAIWCPCSSASSPHSRSQRSSQVLMQN